MANIGQKSFFARHILDKTIKKLNISKLKNEKTIMLWIIISSLALRQYIKNGKKSSNFSGTTSEHTPGFYELESIRLQRDLTAINNKLLSAVAHHERASKTMFYAARKCKSTNVQNRAFFRLRAAENRVLHARRLATLIAQDLTTTNATRHESNDFINNLYDLAYCSNRKLLVHKIKQFTRVK